ncbi:hypothetical protein H0H92_012269 [Tricholoma furcatifolium]|nr:hypothetical protein H0H92_012269 [Tricholoma furcatifolium]
MSASREETQRDKESLQLLKSFIAHDPSADYTFDSEKDSRESEICRHGTPGRHCTTLQMNSQRLFQAMQDLGFFCALPRDPKRTHMECRPMPKP